MEPVTGRLQNVTLYPFGADHVAVNLMPPNSYGAYMLFSTVAPATVTVDGTPTDLAGLFTWIAAARNIEVTVNPVPSAFYDSGVSTRTAFRTVADAT